MLFKSVTNKIQKKLHTPAEQIPFLKSKYAQCKKEINVLTLQQLTVVSEAHSRNVT